MMFNLVNLTTLKWTATPEATKRFQRASAHEYTLEGLLESRTFH